MPQGPNPVLTDFIVGVPKYNPSTHATTIGNGTGSVELDAPTTKITSTLISFDNGSTAPGSDVSLLGADVTTGTSSELDLITGNATGSAVTGPLYMGSGNSAAAASGLVSIGSGTGATTGTAELFTGDASGGDTGGAFVFTGNSDTGRTGNSWLYSGNTSAGTGVTGDINVVSGDSFGGDSGNIHVTTGAAGGTRGNIILDAPITQITNGQLQASTGVEFDIASPTNGGASNTGSVFVFSGDQSGTGQSGTVGLQSGNATGGNSGPCFVGTGNSTGENSAATTVFTGDGHNTGIIQFGTGNASAGNSGDILIGTGTATGTKGNIITPGLPTADPHVVGAWWVDVAGGRVLKVSNG